MALFRAFESTRPENDRLFFDPYAAAFLPDYYKVLLACCRLSFVRKLFAIYIQLRAPGTYTAAVARTKLIDDMVIKAVREEGVNQIIILNATLDTRAHRLNIGLPVNFVEVDHPSIQFIKKSMLQDLLGHPVTHVDYVKLDMNTENLADIVSPRMHRQHYKTLFLWEGLTTQVEAMQAENIFRYINLYPKGTQVIFTYIDKAVLDNPRKFTGFRRINYLLRKAGENWNYGMYPKDIETYIRHRNMTLLYEGGADKYRATYFGTKSSRMKGYEYFRVVRSVLK